MKTLRLFWLCIIAVFVTLADGRAQEAGELRREWTVDGVTREAIIFAPATAKTKAAPAVFAFHGHGGNMRQASRSFGYEKVWPEAIVVYMQGLNTPGRLTDPEGKKPGWQRDVGDQGDRDLHFFDAVLVSLRKDYRVDEKHMYATGHSNGGSFTYLLWAARGDQLAAVAPSAAVMAKGFAQLKPKPVLHVAGQTDPLVKYAWQERMIGQVRTLNQCGEGQSLGDGKTLYPSKIGAPVVTLIHPGGHQFIPEAPAAIVKFFKEH